MEMEFPKDMRCEIYSYITEGSQIIKFLEYYSKTKDKEIKILLGCVRKVTSAYNIGIILQKHYDLFPKLERCPVSIGFALNTTISNPEDISKCEYYKYKGRPLRNIRVLYPEKSLSNIDVFKHFLKIFPFLHTIELNLSINKWILDVRYRENQDSLISPFKNYLKGIQISGLEINRIENVYDFETLVIFCACVPIDPILDKLPKLKYLKFDQLGKIDIQNQNNTIEKLKIKNYNYLKLNCNFVSKMTKLKEIIIETQDHTLGLLHQIVESCKNIHITCKMTTLHSLVYTDVIKKAVDTGKVTIKRI